MTKNNSQPKRLATKRVNVALLTWLLAFALHNAEELWLNMPAWSAAKITFLPHWPAGAFFAVIVALDVAALFVVLAVVFYRQKWAKWAAMVFIAATFVNVFSHVAMSWLAGAYMPGLATSLLLILPADIWAWRELKREKI